MGQSIKLKIAGKEYPLKANSPEMEQVLRLAAQDVNEMLERYTQSFNSKPLEETLVFVALQETVHKITAQRRVKALQDQLDSFAKDTDSYLKGIEQ